ncbi:chitosanase (glycosyl hydrolase group 75) [Streptomyces puniciscabiei]|uniref:Chitosanase (Glycosyl hydrolase group 75) n=1 Tax=Streptomyces puniciscabiei TaxID=164348 RepID=A0A542SYK8_9ACTN|nr:glycoside hydrolase family 75 protein [Streptomyces puniciscabiei]TQK79608.1 chitosanase (glycosyl hydrolase group 75) [Streptomyces puniciscabiei]
MRVPSLTPAVAGVALLAPAALHAPAVLPAPAADGPPRERPVAHSEGAVAATDLLDRLGTCHQISRGRYRTDAGRPATVPVCGTRDAVYWKADLDVDCDGRSTARCNRHTDPQFSTMTAYEQSDGRHLNAARLPYIVVPAPSRIWNPRKYGVRGGSVAAVVYRGRVRYAVVGDIGPRDVIGEASYATARGLGIRADPSGGGAPSGVTYIVFRNSRVHPIENHAAAVSAGTRLARLFLANR